jgi:hypothetical protein
MPLTYTDREYQRATPRERYELQRVEDLARQEERRRSCTCACCGQGSSQECRLLADGGRYCPLCERHCYSLGLCQFWRG